MFYRELGVSPCGPSPSLVRRGISRGSLPLSADLTAVSIPLTQMVGPLPMASETHSGHCTTEQAELLKCSPNCPHGCLQQTEKPSMKKASQVEICLGRKTDVFAQGQSFKSKDSEERTQWMLRDESDCVSTWRDH